MKFTATIAASILAFTSSLALAAPTIVDKLVGKVIDYTPLGGWERVEYPAGTGENLPAYPLPPEGWKTVKYPEGAVGSSPFTFTSTYRVVATGAEVRNGSAPAPGPSDAVGFFEFGINSYIDTICYNITLLNVRGTYLSLAKTATHIHQAVRGASGPPRIALPNPVGDERRRVGVGCLTGPFTTGLNGTDGEDTGTGFRVSMIERDPAAFMADCHTSLFGLGVVRGQLG